MGIIKVKVYPNSKKQEIIKKDKDSFIVYLKEKAKENKANTELIFLLAKYFKVSISKIRIVRGVNTPNKHIQIYEN